MSEQMSDINMSLENADIAHCYYTVVSSSKILGNRKF